MIYGTAATAPIHLTDGNAGHDTLRGGEGDDTLLGGPGLNTINPVTPRKPRDQALIDWATSGRGIDLPLNQRTKTWVKDFVTALGEADHRLGVNRDLVVALPGATR